MEKKGEKNVHSGHRERLTELFSRVGSDNVSDVQAVEYFLTYIFPRGDVNPLAHRLLDEFESFSQIIDASVEDLMRIDGINKRSAQKIANFSELFYYYTTAKMGRKTKVSCKADIISIVEDYLRFRNTENMILLGISAGNIITHKRRIKSDSSGQVSISMTNLAAFLASAKPASFVIAHCHPYGKATPSANDDNAFLSVKGLCNSCGVNFIDSYIVGEDGVYSQSENKLVRIYCDVEQLKTIFGK
ncbi:MAG: hypothetical protein IJ817_02570 [Clostridia bacterium]|nr:hypothetical protein [Clostridia bacterium]